MAGGKGVGLPHRRQGKWVCTANAPGLPKSDAPNGVWAIDFRFDAATDGRAIEPVSIIAEQPRESLTGLSSNPPSPARSPSPSVTASPPNMATPAVPSCDGGLALAGAELPDWAATRFRASFVPPREPSRNSYVESFNGGVRDHGPRLTAEKLSAVMQKSSGVFACAQRL